MNDRQLDQWIKNAMEKNTEEEIRALEEQWTSDHDRAFAPSRETDRKILAAIQRSKKRNPLKKAAAVLLVAGIGLVSLFAFTATPSPKFNPMWKRGLATTPPSTLPKRRR